MDINEKNNFLSENKKRLVKMGLTIPFKCPNCSKEVILFKKDNGTYTQYISELLKKK